MTPFLLLPLAAAATALPGPPPQSGPGASSNPARAAADRLARIGHSAHGDSFDEGPRQRPWRMEGIGRSRFPVTTTVPEVQEWFDQGHTLLHSFWFFEAERAFRWCLKLDPDCAMAWWGMCRANRDDEKRAAGFLREASRRKEKVTRRERLYIEAWEIDHALDLPGSGDPPAGGGGGRWGGGGDAKRARFVEALERIVLEFPDDLEAKALLGLETMRSPSRIGAELVLQQVLAREPDHPGAHHYRIHDWDGEDGVVALDSCERYGRVAPAVGHANHMPGHVFSGVGMWHEAAIWMDSATRAEKEYMRRRQVFPFNSWNYAHNQNYLAYLQAQLGMPSAAERGARELLAAPLDPKHNDPDRDGYWVWREGFEALYRTLIRFERWSGILAPGTLPWRDRLEDRVRRAYAEGLAQLGLGRVEDAKERLAALKQLEEKVRAPGLAGLAEEYDVCWRELEGLIQLRRGETLEGLRLLSEGAARELKRREQDDDPPDHPRVVYGVLGEEYLKLDSARLAAAAFERALSKVRGDAFALAGLARAHAALGERERATECAGRLLHVWSGAEPGLRWMEEVRALGLDARPKDASPRPQRDYRTQVLDAFGPSTWEPCPAPPLAAADSAGATVTLEEYRGRNVLLVFFLGEECPHCMEQLKAIQGRSGEFEALNTALLAISGDPPAELAASEALGRLPFRLLSDAAHENARRFQAFDDFEELELHATILVDRDGRLRWSRVGGAPFTDLAFLLAEIKRIDAAPPPGT